MADWETIGTDDIVTVWAEDYNNHSAKKSYSIQTSTVDQASKLERFEIHPGDEWEGDAERPADYDRAELDSRTIEVEDENGDVFIHLQILPYGVEQGARTSIVQLFNDEVYVQLDTLPSGVVVRTYQGTGGGLTGTDRFTGAPMVSGVPEAWVIRVRSHVSAGQVQVWRDGVEMCNLSDLPIGQDGEIPRWKRGVYRVTNPSTLVLQMANFLRGSAAADCVAAPLAFPAAWPE